MFLQNCAFGCAGLQGAAGSGALQNAAALDCSVAPVGSLQILVSTGRGELVLVSTGEAGLVASAPVHPLPRAQSFILEAAYREPAGTFSSLVAAPVLYLFAPSKTRRLRWQLILCKAQKSTCFGAPPWLECCT